MLKLKLLSRNLVKKNNFCSFEIQQVYFLAVCRKALRKFSLLMYNLCDIIIITYFIEHLFWY